MLHGGGSYVVFKLCSELSIFVPVQFVNQQSGYHGQDYALLVVLETRTVLGQMDRESADVVVPLMYVSIPTC